MEQELHASHTHLMFRLCCEGEWLQSEIGSRLLNSTSGCAVITFLYPCLLKLCSLLFICNIGTKLFGTMYCSQQWITAQSLKWKRLHVKEMWTKSQYWTNILTVWPWIDHFTWAVSFFQISEFCLALLLKPESYSTITFPSICGLSHVGSAIL